MSREALAQDDELELAPLEAWPLGRWYRMVCPHDENADTCYWCHALLDEPVAYVPREAK